MQEVLGMLVSAQKYACRKNSIYNKNIAYLDIGNIMLEGTKSC